MSEKPQSAEEIMAALDRRVTAILTSPEHVKRLADAKAAEERERAEDEDRRVEAERQAEMARVAALDIPVEYLDLVTSEQFQPTEATAAVADVRGLVILGGGVGCGKTAAACSWLYSGRAGGGLFLKAQRLARWPRYDNAQMDRVLGIPRLVIDDVGAEFQDKFGAFQSLLDEVIDGRVSNRRATVMTTNLPADEFRARYLERIADRIRGSGRYVGISAGSMRGRR